MARKTKTFYVCNNCGEEFTKWQGKCFNCGQWETIVEFKQPALKGSSRRSAAASSPDPIVLSACSSQSITRQKTGLHEMDRVLGGGLVAGGVILLGGDPGIGKSTLLLQLGTKLAQTDECVLYVSGEESADQISLRAKRLGVAHTSLHILTETTVESALNAMQKLSPQAVVVDSIQTVFTEELESAPGSVSQVRECAAKHIR